MVSDYIICIPSYKRENVCNEKTLKTLEDNNIKREKIYVFVANKEEYKKYKETLDKRRYNKIIIGVVGLIEQRDFIEKRFKKGKEIVFMDDDVENIDLTLSPMFKRGTLHKFLIKAFEITRKNNGYIWGVYPVFNPFFRSPKKEITTHLNYIVGAFYGIINRPNIKDLELKITKKYGGQKEDVERTLKYFIKDGVVIRFNKIGFKTKYYGKQGGLGTFEERLKPMREASNELKNKYSEYGEIYTKKTGMTEFKLKKLYELPKHKKNVKKTRRKRINKNKKTRRK